MPRKSIRKLRDYVLNEPAEGRLLLELRKLTNSEGWVSTSQPGSSNSSSRASTPNPTPNSTPNNSRSNVLSRPRGRPRKSIPHEKKKSRPRGRPPGPFSNKKFKMVLEKDDEFEVDYVTPDEDEDNMSSYSGTKDDYSDSEGWTDNLFNHSDSGRLYPTMMEVEEEEIKDYPPLELPPSSDDLLIPNKLLIQALSIYEILRHFRTILRLSPMIFEDFCAALLCNDTSVLINEVHIAMLKSILKEEDTLNNTFVPQDQKDAQNAVFYFIDYLTWPDVLKAYLGSSPEFSYVTKILEDPLYPCVNVEDKLKVLELVANLYIGTTKIRDKLMMDGTIRYDDHCRVCHKLGDLLCCETCSAVYHLACCNPKLKEVPDEEWLCEVCVSHKLDGVTNCENDTEFHGQYLRHDALGVDRHGRKYWFLARRLIVDDKEGTKYYTTSAEIQYIFSHLDPDEYEVALCEAIRDIIDEVPRQCYITESLTNTGKWPGKTVIDNIKDRTKQMIENEKIAEEKKVKEEEEKRKKREEEEKRKKAEEEEAKEEEEKRKKKDEVKEKKIEEEEYNKNAEKDLDSIPENKDLIKQDDNKIDEKLTVIKTEDIETKTIEKTQETDNDVQTEKQTENKDDSDVKVTIKSENSNIITDEKMEVDVSVEEKLKKSEDPVEEMPSKDENTLPVQDEIADDQTSKTEDKETVTTMDLNDQAETKTSPKVENLQSTITLSSTENTETQNISISGETSSKTELEPLANIPNTVESSSTNTDTITYNTPTSTPIKSTSIITSVIATKLDSPTVLNSSPLVKSINLANLNASKLQTNPPKLPGIKLANISVPLQRCDSIINSAGINKTNSAFKVGGSIQVKTTSSPNLTTLKNLFVLNKNGKRTPITVGPGGKIIAGGPQKIVFLNRKNPNIKIANSVESRQSRELRKLQFSGAGPKLQKIVRFPLNNQVLNNSAQNQQNLVKPALKPEATEETVPEPQKPPFKLGEDDAFLKYKNHYVENPLALNKYQHKEEKDKERQIGHKFSLSGSVEFEWGGKLYGSQEEIVHTLRCSLFKFEQQIPLCFMHSKWEQYRKMWGHMLLQNQSPKAFAAVLGILEMAIKDSAKRAVWKESMGQCRMRRLTVAEKEDYEKKKKFRAKVEEDIANMNAVWCKYPLPVKSMQVWKMKGEEYRVTGYGGWMWVSSTFCLRNSKPKPPQLVEPNAEGVETKTKSTENIENSDTKSESTKDVETKAKSTDDVEPKMESSENVEPKMESSENVEAKMESTKIEATKNVETKTESTKDDESTTISAEKMESTESITNNSENIEVEKSVTQTSNNNSDDCDPKDITTNSPKSQLSEKVEENMEIDKNVDTTETDGAEISETKTKNKVSENTTEIKMDTSVTEDASDTNSTECKDNLSNKNISILQDSEIKQDTTKSIPEDTKADSEKQEILEIPEKLISDADLKLELENLIKLEDVINISNHLLKRSCVYNKKWKASKLDSLLKYRILQEKKNQVLRQKELAVKEKPTDISSPKESLKSEDDETISASETEVSDCEEKKKENSVKSDKDNIKYEKSLNLEKNLTTFTEPITKSTTISQSMEDSTPKNIKTTDQNTKLQIIDKCNKILLQDNTGETENEVSSQNADTKIVTPQTENLNTNSSLPETTDMAIGKPEPNNIDNTLPETLKVSNGQFNGDNNIASTRIKDNQSEVLVKDILENKKVLKVNNLPPQDSTYTTTEHKEKEVPSMDVDPPKLNDKPIEITTPDTSNPDQTTNNDDNKSIENQPPKSPSKPTQVISNNTDNQVPLKPDIKDPDNKQTEGMDVDINDSIMCNGISENSSDVIEKSIETTTTKTNTITKKVTVSENNNLSTETVTTVTTTSTTTSTIIKNISPTVNASTSESTTTSSSKESINDTLKVDCTSGDVERSSISKISRRFRSKIKVGGETKSESSEEKVETRLAWKLKTNLLPKKKSVVKMPLPWKFTTGKGKKRNLFRLPKNCVRFMAIRGGMTWQPFGFHYVQKTPTSLELFWPYPCARPTIGTCWRYKLQNSNTLASIAYLLKMLWHSMRWDEIVTRPSHDENYHVIHTDESIITTELLKRRNVGNTGLKSEYYVRRIVMPNTEEDEEIPQSEVYTPSSRSGLRQRSRPMSLRERSKKDADLTPKVEEVWMAEDLVELWQIRQFDSMFREQQKRAQVAAERFTGKQTTVFPISKTPIRVNIQNTSKQVLVPNTTTQTKHVTISTALLKQAAALHRNNSNLLASPVTMSPQPVLNNSSLQSDSSSLIKLSDVGKTGTHKITFNPQTPTQQIIPLKSASGGLKSTPTQGGTLIQTGSGHTFFQAKTGAQYIVQGNKVVPRQLLLRSPQIVQTKQTSNILSGNKIIANNSSNIPTIRLQPTPQTNQPQIISNIVPTVVQDSSSTNMQVKLSAPQLAKLMKVNMGTIVRVSVTLSDGTPGIGQLQVIPPGAQINPNPGQQLMQCKVGNDVRRFLLTALSGKAETPAPMIVKATPSTPQQTMTPPQAVNPARHLITGAAKLTPEYEASLKTLSLRDRLEQLQQKQQQILKQGSTDVRRLMTDKDPLWGGRTLQIGDKQTGGAEKRRDIIHKKRHPKESREEAQRKTVVQQVMKSMLDRIERKEELEARRRRRELKEEQLKRKKETMDEARTQQRLHSRLVHTLRRHQDQLKQEIRKRKTITEKYLTWMVENELHEDKIKLKKRRPNFLIETKPSPASRKSNYLTTGSALTSILTESNKKRSPKKVQKRARKRTVSAEKITATSNSPPKKKRMISTSTKLYCICKTPYDDSRFYIGCDLCMNWFHGECVGISEKTAKIMENWCCTDCEQTKPQQELYCICRTPYDDAQFYIGCDACQDWYHGACVGILEEEASKIESYTCPKCKKNQRDASQENALSDRDLQNLTKIVKHLQNHKSAWPFLEPVREKDAPGYYKVVKRPMDLQTVMKRLHCKYYIKLSELVGDVSLIFDNCRQFNGADSKIVRCAEIVETVFVGKMRDLRGR